MLENADQKYSKSGYFSSSVMGDLIRYSYILLLVI